MNFLLHFGWLFGSLTIDHQGGEEGESLNEDEENGECSESFWNFCLVFRSFATKEIERILWRWRKYFATAFWAVFSPNNKLSVKEREEEESLNEGEENDECSESFWNFQEE